MKLVQQLNKSSGCGPACVAMISGKSYDQAIQAIFEGNYKNDLYTEYADLRRGLDEFKVLYDPRPLRMASWDSLTKTAIVACDKKKTGISHWVVYDARRKVVMDPMMSEPTVLHGRDRTPFSYLAVYPKSARSVS